MLSKPLVEGPVGATSILSTTTHLCAGEDIEAEGVLASNSLFDLEYQARVVDGDLVDY